MLAGELARMKRLGLPVRAGRSDGGRETEGDGIEVVVVAWSRGKIRI